MRYSISDTAEFGDYEVGKRLITDETKKEMKKVLGEIQDGTFARNWIMENKMGRSHFNAVRRIEKMCIRDRGYTVRRDAEPYLSLPCRA